MADHRSLADRKREQRASTVMGLWGLLVLFGVGMAFMSVMATDAPGSARDPRVMAFVYACRALPVFAGVAAIGGYYSVKLSKPRLALLTAIPAILAVLAFVGTLGAWWT